MAYRSIYEGIRMSIRKKLIFSFIFIILSFAIIGILNYLLQVNYKKQLDIVSGKMFKIEKNSQNAKFLIKEILLDVLNRNKSENNKILKTKVDQKAIEFYKNIDIIIEYGENRQNVLEKIREIFQQFYVLSLRVSAYMHDASIGKHPDTLKLYYNLEKELQTLIDKTFSSYEQEFEKALLNMSANSKKTIYISSLLIFIGVIFSFLIFYVLIKTIMTPINNLIETINNFDTPGTEEATIFRSDEFGKMAGAFNSLSKKLQKTIENLKNEIGEKKKAEKNILRLKDFLSNTINSMPSILIGINEEQYITQWNNTAMKITDIDKEQALGNKLLKIFPSIAPFEGVIINSLQDRNIKKDMLPILINKKKRYMELTIFPLTDKREKGAVIILDDITKRKLLEEELRQAQKMEIVGTLAGGLAHDFNNVLGGIIGTLSILKIKKNNNTLTNERLDEYLNNINISADRATHLVKQLLSISRKQELLLMPLDLNNTIKNVIKICKTTFDKSIKIKTSYSRLPAVIKADTNQIEQVLLNLAINSSHAMTLMKEEGVNWGGVLEIGLRSFSADKQFCEKFSDAREITYWELYVQDDGIGMTTSVKEKIFDPFFTTKEKGIGTGLGLSMVYNIIKQHNGFVNIYSEVGKGSKFSLYFPKINDLQINDTENNQKDIDFSCSGYALVVDDELIMRKVASEILSEMGFNILVAKDGDEGIEMFIENQDRIKFVILDLMMPKKSGDKVLDEIKKHNSEVVVLLTSGFKKDERLKKALSYNNVSFIEKPYSFTQLTDAVKNLIKEAIKKQ